LVEEKKSDGHEYKVWGLVDLNCRRVYALKVLLFTPVSAALGYALVPLYGTTNVSKPNQPAVEKATIPDIATELQEDLPQDDEFDDKEPSKPPSSEEASLATFTQINDHLGKIAESLSKLESMDASINRLATAVESFVALYGQK